MTRVILVVSLFLIEKHIVNLYGLIIHGLIRTFVWIAGLKYLKLSSEISRVNFINLNAYKFGQPAILASKHCSLLTGSRGVSVKRGPDTCGWWMRMGKCGWKNVDGKMRKDAKKVKKRKRRKRMAEMNKQTMERNLSFKSLSRDWGSSFTECVVNSWHRLLRVFSQFFEPLNSFH